MDMLCVYIGEFGTSPSALIHLKERFFLLASIISRMRGVCFYFRRVHSPFQGVQRTMRIE